MKPDRADLYPDAAYQSEIFCKDSKRERRAEPVRACPNRLLSDAKIVKAERSAKFICWSKYEGENETYIEASVENSSSILYDKEIRNKPRTRRTKRNV